MCKMCSEVEINILVCCTGSVAAIKLPLLLETLIDESKTKCILKLKTCMTEHAKHFCDVKDIESLTEVYCDADEWSTWKDRGDPVLHIELSKWADMIVVAPMDANTLAKISSGICDNMVTCVVRAWEIKKPLVFCPAMNTKMWTHPVTSQQVSLLKSWGYEEIPCISKTLMCGDKGFGAMAEPREIVNAILPHIEEIKRLKGTPV